MLGKGGGDRAESEERDDQHSTITAILQVSQEKIHGLCSAYQGKTLRLWVPSSLIKIPLKTKAKKQNKKQTKINN